VYFDPAAFASQVMPGDCAQDFTTLPEGPLGNNVSFCGSPGSQFAYSAATVDPTSGLYGDEGLSTEAFNDVLMLTFRDCSCRMQSEAISSATAPARSRLAYRSITVSISPS